MLFCVERRVRVFLCVVSPRLVCRACSKIVPLLWPEGISSVPIWLISTPPPQHLRQPLRPPTGAGCAGNSGDSSMPTSPVVEPRKHPATKVLNMVKFQRAASHSHEKILKRAQQQADALILQNVAVQVPAGCILADHPCCGQVLKRTKTHALRKRLARLRVRYEQRPVLIVRCLKVAVLDALPLHPAESHQQVQLHHRQLGREVLLTSLHGARCGNGAHNVRCLEYTLPAVDTGQRQQRDVAQPVQVAAVVCIRRERLLDRAAIQGAGDRLIELPHIGIRFAGRMRQNLL
mmetsp:Transcript_38994/g.99712  ORF Transcript_38994/g.99712 Transcript_38994/m.99712 type:complete len:290 (-) Transcript_38994:14-883(-)